MAEQEWEARCREVEQLLSALSPPDDDRVRWALGAARLWWEAAACAHWSGDDAGRERALGHAAAAFDQLAVALRDEYEGHPLVDVEVILDGILIAWAAGRDEVAERLGRLPTQRFRPRGRAKPDEPLMFATFAVASAARGNAPARDRAIANAREAIAAGRTADLTRARGAIAPLLDGVEAVARGRGKALERALSKLVRYHRWRYRERETPLAALDVRGSALARWAARCGVSCQVTDPLLAPVAAGATR
ncbi:MAG: Imm49 family immunity protein [Chloroflexota bacterium]|nr:immunity 49 family protein [Dehalococcoidia bacterium]MDW8254440.1 Imm49 family immunity protein [Chloroflexota bacterium]